MIDLHQSARCFLSSDLLMGVKTRHLLLYPRANAGANETSVRAVKRDQQKTSGGKPVGGNLPPQSCVICVCGSPPARSGR